MAASSPAVRRLQRDLEAIRRSPNPQIVTEPSSENLLEWHFALHNLPQDSPYVGGLYHGKLMFPEDYPHAPPRLQMLTPNGRVHVGRPICLSMTSYHPESWNPAWSVETLLVGFLSFFLSEDMDALGTLQASSDDRKRLAAESRAICAKDDAFRELFPQLLEDSSGAATLQGAPPIDATTEASLSTLVLDDDGARPPHAAAAETQAAAAPVEEPPKCWICHDTSSDEPLVLPCACRGTMSGVHASCVNEWVRRASAHGTQPQCPVCKEEYVGEDKGPGLSGFLMERGPLFLYFVCRFCLHWGALWLYVRAMSTKAQADIATPWRVFAVVLFGALALCKITVLVVTLPCGDLHSALAGQMGPPPQRRLLQAFYESDRRSLACHYLEMCYGFGYLATALAFGSIHPWGAIPFLLLPLAPFIKVLIGNSMRQCAWRSLLFFGSLLAAPLLLVLCLLASPFILLHVMVLHSHPLDAGPHIFFELAGCATAIIFRSRFLTLMVLALHTLLLLGGLVDLLVLRRLKWRAGRTQWWLAVALPWLCWLALTVRTDWLVLISASVWWGLVVCLSTAINWQLLLEPYHRWRRSHATFTVVAPTAPASAAAASASNASGVVPGQVLGAPAQADVEP